MDMNKIEKIKQADARAEYEARKFNLLSGVSTIDKLFRSKYEGRVGETDPLLKSNVLRNALDEALNTGLDEKQSFKFICCCLDDKCGILLEKIRDMVMEISGIENTAYKEGYLKGRKEEVRHGKS